MTIEWLGIKRLGRGYNEFRDTWFRWKDHVSITLFDFSILLVRKYDWFEKSKVTWIVVVLGFQSVWLVKKERE